MPWRTKSSVSTPRTMRWCGFIAWGSRETKNNIAGHRCRRMVRGTMKRRVGWGDVVSHTLLHVGLLFLPSFLLSFFPSLCPPLSLFSSGHTFGLRPRLSVAPVHLGLEGVVKEEVGGGKKSKKKADQRQQQEGQVFAVTFVDGSRCMVEQGPSAPSKPDGHGTSGGCRVCLYVCLYLFGVLMCISVCFWMG